MTLYSSLDMLQTVPMPRVPEAYEWRRRHRRVGLVWEEDRIYLPSTRFAGFAVWLIIRVACRPKKGAWAPSFPWNAYFGEKPPPLAPGRPYHFGIYLRLAPGRPIAPEVTLLRGLCSTVKEVRTYADREDWTEQAKELMRQVYHPECASTFYPVGAPPDRGPITVFNYWLNSQVKVLRGDWVADNGNDQFTLYSISKMSRSQKSITLSRAFEILTLGEGEGED